MLEGKKYSDIFYELFNLDSQPIVFNASFQGFICRCWEYISLTREDSDNNMLMLMDLFLIKGMASLEKKLKSAG